MNSEETVESNVVYDLSLTTSERMNSEKIVESDDINSIGDQDEEQQLQQTSNPTDDSLTETYNSCSLAKSLQEGRERR